jgi:hypothetical protein
MLAGGKVARLNTPVETTPSGKIFQLLWHFKVVALLMAVTSD